MKIVCTQENLHKALQLVGRVVGTRANLPVLANVLLQSESGRLKISATDLEVGLTTRIWAKVASEGEITVPARSFAEFISTVSDETITLEAKDGVLKVSGEKTNATFRGIDAEEFPVIPSVQAASAITVPGSVLLQALKQVVVAAATDDTRPVLAGVLLRWNGTTFITVATDTYRLAEKKITLDAGSGAGEAVVPSRGIHELIRVIATSGADSVQVAMQDNQILFSFGETELVSRIVEGKYPDYEKIIPDKKKTSAVIENNELKSTLKTATIFAREAANTAKFHFGPSNEIIISALANQLGDATVKASAEIDGEEMECSFNVKYISDAVQVIGDDQLVITLSGALQPGIIQGTKSADYRYLIMPLRST